MSARYAFLAEAIARTIAAGQVSFDDAEAAGLDGTLRTNGGREHTLADLTAVAHLVRAIEAANFEDFLSDPGGYIAYADLTDSDEIASAATRVIARQTYLDLQESGARDIVAECLRCQESFLPAGDTDLIHIERADGQPCGGDGAPVGGIVR